MTSGVKVGQRVRFAGEGVVERAGGASNVCVQLPIGWQVWLPLGLVEVLPEPLKVGDEIELGVDPEPPLYSLLVGVGGILEGATYRRVIGDDGADLWWYTPPRSAGWTSGCEWGDLNDVAGSWRVVWLPGNPQ